MISDTVHTIEARDISQVRMQSQLQYHLFKYNNVLLGRFSTLEQVQRFANVLNTIEIEVYHVRGETRALLEILNPIAHA